MENKATKLWDKLGNIPTGDDDCIELPFEHFKAGTHREEIWHWFEATFKVRVYDLQGKSSV
jgi:hypothetical protein